MFGLIALRGGKSPRNGTYPTDSCLVTSDVERICAWINLLKQMTLSVTPDVVLVYLLATRQTDIAQMVFSDSEEYSLGCDGREFPSPGKQYCYGDTPYGTGMGEPFPAEAINMAGNYLRKRWIKFLDLITDAVDYGCGFKRVGLGQKIPKAVANALSGFTCVMSDINTAANAVNAFHATVMPDVASNSYFRPNVHPSLKWNPTVSFVDCGWRYRETDFVDLTAAHIRKLMTFTQALSTVRWELSRILQSGKETDVHLAQVVAKGLEALLYIKCVASSYGSERAMFLPFIRDLNKLRETSKGNTTGNGDDRSTNVWYSVLCRCTPAAVICAADLVVRDRRNGGIDWMYGNNSVVSTASYLFVSKHNPNVFSEVVDFMNLEYAFQREQFGRHERIAKEKGSRCYERCCDEPACCGECCG